MHKEQFKTILITAVLVLPLVACAPFGRHMTNLVIKVEYETGSYLRALGEYEENYIRESIYFKMPETDFMDSFKKRASRTEPSQPYIISQKNHTYKVRGNFFYKRYNDKKTRKRFMARCTFENRLLIRYEYFDYDFKCVTIKGGQWIDFTHRLKDYQE
tara:strand:- start:40 stop:513 length:474 start_codon:yes stop_codon:yes gene_type:complete